MKWLALALALSGCAHALAFVPPQLAFVDTPSWKTLSAQHRVVLTVRLDGHNETRSLRGLIAVEQPDRLRLRALGPAGITLFDLLVRAGQPKVISAIRQNATLDDIIHLLAADLACAYALSPAIDRKTKVVDSAIVVTEPGRTVTLSKFVGTPPTWRRAEIETPKYHVTVNVESVELDRALDPAMFAD